MTIAIRDRMKVQKVSDLFFVIDREAVSIVVKDKMTQFNQHLLWLFLEIHCCLNGWFKVCRQWLHDVIEVDLCVEKTSIKDVLGPVILELRFVHADMTSAELTLIASH